MMLFKRVIHHLRHFQLPAPVLVPANHAPFQKSPWPKHIPHGWLCRFRCPLFFLISCRKTTGFKCLVDKHFRLTPSRRDLPQFRGTSNRSRRFFWQSAHSFPSSRGTSQLCCFRLISLRAD